MFLQRSYLTSVVGDMIADGILLAFKELQVDVPVVVRIRGTNEKEGQKVVSLLLR